MTTTPIYTKSISLTLPLALKSRSFLSFGYNTDIVILGSCNGLLCISNGVNQIAFWNPSTRKHRIIPYSPVPTCSEEYGTFHSNTAHGFAFDPLVGDYKLVTISVFISEQETFHSHVRLFSSKTNSWRVLPNMLHAPCTQTPLFVDNCLHWVEIRKPGQLQCCSILAFNLTREIFNHVPVPEIRSAANDEGLQIVVSVLGECLCMTVNYKTINSQCLYYQTTKSDVWVMKEYGVRDSWCILFSWHFNTPWIALKPLGYFSDKSKVLLEVDCNQLFWYDIKSEKVTCVPRVPSFNKSMIYVGSLLPPFLPIDNDDQSKESKRKGR